VCLADNPDARLRDVAARVGITERTAFRLIGELEEAGIVERAKEGRRNHYVINTEAHLRHSIEDHCTVGDLLKTVLPNTPRANN
jgi:DNA-binding IclR family transcriptional regulator